MTPAVFSVGHSNHALERFLALLRQHGICTVADVRSRPYSKWDDHIRGDGRVQADRALDVASPQLSLFR